jgi:hypothetical protein
MGLFSRFNRSTTPAEPASGSPPSYPLDSKHAEASSDKSGAGDDSSIQVLGPGGELTYEEGEYLHLNDYCAYLTGILRRPGRHGPPSWHLQLYHAHVRLYQ